MKLQFSIPQVKPVSDKEFQALCLTLRRQIEERIAPDLVMGVERGGGFVVRAWSLAAEPPSWKEVFVSCARPLTRQKTNWLRPLVARLPNSIQTVLRQAEHLTRELVFRFGRPSSERLVQMDSATRDAIRSAQCICIVDDAVDTGFTIEALQKEIADLNPRAAFYSATITQTFDSPVVPPDVTLFKKLLCRFPWALDA